MSVHPEEGSVQTVSRRRPTRRHRRNRFIRRALAAATLVVLAFTCGMLGLHHLAPSIFRASRADADRQSAEASREWSSLLQQEILHSVEKRPVYPYSVVPGGVKDVQELKWAVEHDPTVGAHYAGFDFRHARLLRVAMDRSAYLSYRIGNRVYWTRHRVSLRKGEELITDGKITGRTRCANRVEEQPQQATSSSEPPAANFEEPAHPATAFAGPPVPFESALLNRSPIPGLGPAPPLSLYDPFGSGTWVPIAPPELPSVCGVGKKPKGGSGGKKGKGNPCGESSGGTVPEPGTWLLVASGLGLIYWKARHRIAPTLG